MEEGPSHWDTFTLTDDLYLGIIKLSTPRDSHPPLFRTSVSICVVLFMTCQFVGTLPVLR